MKAAWTVVLLVLVVPFGSAQGWSQTNDRRDGNLWLELTTTERAYYLVGFFDGMELGKNFSFWAMLDDKHDRCAGEVAASYSSYMSKYMTNVTSGQLSAGLTDFYRDYRNRSIRISDAVWPVLQEIAGDPKEKTEPLIENLRKNAQQN